MATLGTKDAKNSATKGNYSGKTRLEIFNLRIKRMREGKKYEPFRIGKNGEEGPIYGIAVTNKVWPYELSYAMNESQAKKGIVFGTIQATQIYKDADFGGGGGSGGGAAATKIVESLQCYYSSLLYNSNLTELTIENISFDLKKNKISPLYSTEKYCDTTVSLDECLKKDPWGAAVYIKIANALYESKAGKEFKESKKVYFHRGSKFMDAVYARKKRCLDHDKRLAKDRGISPVAPAAFSNDKWNPGDIWMTTQTDNTPFPHHLNEGELGEHTCDWGSLKDVVRESAEKGITLGVSLKKVDSGATVQEYNTKERSQNLNPVWRGFTFGRKGDFFSSADMYVRFSTIDIQFRSTATTSSWQGEIKGGIASGGKIGGGGVQYYVEKYFGKTTTIGLNAIAGHGWKETSSISVDRAWILYKKFNELQNKYTETLDKETFKTNWKAANAGLRFSKGMNLEFLDVMYNRGTTLRSGPDLTKFAKDIFRYAASNTDYSSFFVKIS